MLEVCFPGATKTLTVTLLLSDLLLNILRNSSGALIAAPCSEPYLPGDTKQSFSKAGSGFSITLIPGLESVSV